MPGLTAVASKGQWAEKKGSVLLHWGRFWRGITQERGRVEWKWEGLIHPAAMSPWAHVLMAHHQLLALLGGVELLASEAWSEDVHLRGY